MIVQDHEYLDNMVLSMYRTCPRKCYYRAELGIVPAEGTSTPLSFGIAIHLGIELWLAGHDEHQAVAEALKYYEPLCPVSETKRTIGKLQDLLEYYFQYYTNDGFQVIHVLDPLNPGTMKPAVETGFGIPLFTRDDGLVVMYSGRQDAIGTWRQRSGKVYGKDIKTTSSPGMFLANPNSQFTGYIWAGQQLIPGYVGMIIDMIGVFKTKPQKLRSGGFAAGKGLSDIFFRYETTREQWEVNEWVTETTNLIKSMWKSRKIQQWSKNPDACMNYNSPCPYLELCNLVPSMREELINSSMYKVDPWYPHPDLAKANNKLSSDKKVPDPSLLGGSVTLGITSPTKD